MSASKLPVALFVALLMTVFSPAFVRTATAASLGSQAPLIPAGDELDGASLLEVEGEFWWVVALFLKVAIPGSLAGYATYRQSGCLGSAVQWGLITSIAAGLLVAL